MKIKAFHFYLLSLALLAPVMIMTTARGGPWPPYPPPPTEYEYGPIGRTSTVKTKNI